MATAPVGTEEKPLTAGAIWFNTTNHSIEVYNGSTWSAFSGVLNAAVANEVLTITKHDGSTVSVDFSVYATDEALNLLSGRVGTLETTVGTHGSSIENLQGRMTTVEGKASAAEGQLAGLTETTVMAEIAKQVKVESDRALEAEGDLDERLDTLETKVNTDHEGRIGVLESFISGGEEGESVQDLISAAVDTLEEKINDELEKKANDDEFQAYVESNDTAVAAAQKTADDEVVRAMAAEAGLQEQLGEGFSKDATVAAAVKSAQDAADAAQKTIDDFLTGEGIDPNKVDALKEIVKYMEDHGAEYEAVVENLNTLNTNVAGLQGQVGEGTVDSRIEAAKTAAVSSANGYTDEKIAAEVLRADGKYEEKGVAKGLVDTLAERVSANETAVNTTLPAAINKAKEDAIADADGKLAAAKTELQGYADQAEADALSAAQGYADEKVKGLADGAVAANTLAISNLDAKVTEGLAWVIFE